MFAQVPDYYQLVKKPMDLQSMREKLNDVKYTTDAEVIADALLIFQVRNCVPIISSISLWLLRCYSSGGYASTWLPVPYEQLRHLELPS